MKETSSFQCNTHVYIKYECTDSPGTSVCEDVARMKALPQPVAELRFLAAVTLLSQVQKGRENAG